MPGSLHCRLRPRVTSSGRPSGPTAFHSLSPAARWDTPARPREEKASPCRPRRAAPAFEDSGLGVGSVALPPLGQGPRPPDRPLKEWLCFLPPAPRGEVRDSRVRVSLEEKGSLPTEWPLSLSSEGQRWPSLERRGFRRRSDRITLGVGPLRDLGWVLLTFLLTLRAGQQGGHSGSPQGRRRQGSQGSRRELSRCVRRAASCSGPKTGRPSAPPQHPQPRDAAEPERMPETLRRHLPDVLRLPGGPRARHLRGLRPALDGSCLAPAPQRDSFSFQESGQPVAGNLQLSVMREFTLWKLDSILSQAFSPRGPTARPCQQRKIQGAGETLMIVERYEKSS